MYNLADIVSTGYQTGAKIGQDITAGNILQEAYKGVDAADPQAAVTINQKAAQLAGMTGNASLAHTFQKEASSLVTDAQKQQLDKTTTQLKQLDLGSRVAKNAKTESDLYGALDTAGLDTNTKMVLRQQISNFKKPDGTFDIEGARKMVVGLGTSEAQDLAAQIKVLQANENIRHHLAQEDLSLQRTRDAAANQANKETAEEKRAAKADDKFRSEVHDIERDFDRQRTRISQDPFMKPKDKQKALDDIDEREEKRKSESKQRYYPEHKEETQSPPSEKPVAKPAETKPSETKPTATKEDKDVYVVPGTDIGYVKPKSMTDKQWEDWKKNEAPKNNKGIEKKLPSSTAIKDYADKYFGGNVDKALEYLKKQGYK